MRPPPYAVGATPPAPLGAPAEPETFTLRDIRKALGEITPTLLVVGIVTGAAFAIGSGLVSHYVWKGR